MSPKVTKSCSKKKAKIATKSMFMDNFQNLIKTFFHHYIGSKLFLSFFKMSVMHEENLGQYNWHKISKFDFLWNFGENSQNYAKNWVKFKIEWAVDGHIIGRSANRPDRNYGLPLYFLHPKYQVRTKKIGGKIGKSYPPPKWAHFGGG